MEVEEEVFPWNSFWLPPPHQFVGKNCGTLSPLKVMAMESCPDQPLPGKTPFEGINPMQTFGKTLAGLDKVAFPSKAGHGAQKGNGGISAVSHATPEVSVSYPLVPYLGAQGD